MIQWLLGIIVVVCVNAAAVHLSGDGSAQRKHKLTRLEVTNAGTSLIQATLTGSDRRRMAPIQFKALKGRAASSALAAIRDMSELEKQLAAADKSARGMRALERGSTLHKPLNAFYKGAHTAVKLALASGVAIGDEEQSDLSRLDEHLQALLAAQDNEALYWHQGPVQLILKQFDKIFNEEMLGRLSTMALNDTNAGANNTHTLTSTSQHEENLMRARERAKRALHSRDASFLAKGFEFETAHGLGPLGVNAAALRDLKTQAEQFSANDFMATSAKDFFDPPTWSAIVAEAKRLWQSDELEPNCGLDGKDRFGGYVLSVGRGSNLYSLIHGNEYFRRWVSAVNGNGQMWPSDFPIELREYGRQSDGMACHRDIQMYDDQSKDTEFAITIENDSKSDVTFTDAHGKTHTVHTTPNSVMMVRSQAALHCVSGTQGGTRTILKFIYTGTYSKGPSFQSYAFNDCGVTSNNLALKAKKDGREP